jgi:integrase
MHGSPFTLTKRQPSGIYYVRFRLLTGGWSGARSTGERSKRAAIEWCHRYLIEHGQPTGKRIKFEDFARGYFDEDGRYAKRYNAHRARDVRPSHLRNQRGRLTNYLIPMFGHYYLEDLTPGLIDRTIFHIRDNEEPKRTNKTGKLSARTINAVRSALSAILEDAVLQGYIRHNPVKDVRRLTEHAERRGILTVEEIRKLMDRNRAGEVWTDMRYWLITEVAITTAARSGELRTLHPEDVIENGLVIRRSWDDAAMAEMEGTKNGLVRTVPLHPRVHADIHNWIRMHAIQPGQYIFFGKDGPDRPMSRAAVIDNFKEALRNIGIPDFEQRRRNLQFHGLRHAATTLLVASGANPWLIRQLTGHKTEAVFEHYADHAEAADWGPVTQWQGTLLPEAIIEGAKQ